MSDNGFKNVLRDCPDCGAEPGKQHEQGCDVERCSVCGNQKIGCNCKGHDSLFARWTGIWPGLAESMNLGLDLNRFYTTGLYTAFFIKPERK